MIVRWVAWDRKEKYMYNYISDKEFLKRMRSLCSDIINQLVQAINNDSVMTVKAHLIGSGAKHLETQNANEPVDLDYNISILKIYEFDINNGRDIKEYVRKQFNAVLQANGWGDCQDSTSALSTEKRHFKKGNQTEFSMDVGIVIESDNEWYRLIHEKTGFVSYDRYYWNKLPESKGLTKRVDKLKKNHLWEDVRETYLNKKNLYLRQRNYNHPSFNVYIEAVNEVYFKHFN